MSALAAAAHAAHCCGVIDRNHSLLGRTTLRLGRIHAKLGQTAEAIKAYDAGLSRLLAHRKRTQDGAVDRDIADIRSDLEKCRTKQAGK